MWSTQMKIQNYLELLIRSVWLAIRKIYRLQTGNPYGNQLRLNGKSDQRPSVKTVRLSSGSRRGNDIKVCSLVKLLLLRSWNPTQCKSMVRPKVLVQRIKQRRWVMVGRFYPVYLAQTTWISLEDKCWPRSTGPSQVQRSTCSTQYSEWPEIEQRNHIIHDYREEAQDEIWWKRYKKIHYYILWMRLVR